MDDPTLAALYANAAAFAYVSLYEGFGIPTLEAMAAGCPLVTSHTSSIPELVEDAGQYVDPFTVESIAAGLKQVLENEDWRNSLIMKGKKQAARFTWKKTAQLTIEFYQYAACHKNHIKRVCDGFKESYASPRK